MDLFVSTKLWIYLNVSDHEMNFLSNLVDSNLNTVRRQMFGKSILFKAWIRNNKKLARKEASETNAVNDRVRRAFMSNK